MNNLSIDIVNHVYEYDGTYREQFQETLEVLVTDKMKALEHFLEWENGFEMWEWQTIKSVYNDDYLQVSFKNTDERYFCVLRLEETFEFDRIDDEYHVLLTKSYLSGIYSSYIADIVGCDVRIIDDIQKTHSKETVNQILFDLLGKDGYKSIVGKLRDRYGHYNIYDQFIHRFLFKDLVEKKKYKYNEWNSLTYEYFNYGETDYVIYWMCLETPII